MSTYNEFTINIMYACQFVNLTGSLILCVRSYFTCNNIEVYIKKIVLMLQKKLCFFLKFQIGSICGIVIIAAAFVIQSILYPGHIFHPPWRVLLVTTLLPICGFGGAYGVSRLCRQPHPLCRTIGLEAGFQNVGMAISIIALSFPDKALDLYSLPGMLYAVTMVFEGLLFTVTYKLIVRFKPKTEEPDHTEDNDSLQILAVNPDQIQTRNI